MKRYTSIFRLFSLRWYAALLIAASAAGTVNILAADQALPARVNATVIAIHDAIGPATSDFFLRVLERANQRDNALLVLELDTPGGLDTSMRSMIQAILASKVPVICYVSPSGARAASAGTYLLYASHVAAMAPATNLGAATPVSIMPAQEAPKADDGAKDDSTDNKDRDTPIPIPGTTMERKAINDAVAYIRSLAELRGRNADWAESAVRSAASLSATAALQQQVIDVVAKDIPDLLQQINGRKIKVANGEVTLHTQEMVLERIQADWRTKVLAIITNPNVAYLLMLVGIYGLLLEGYNPGSVLPGVVGAISLLLALFAFQVLSVNYAGLALIALGTLLIVAEASVPSFGALGLGGIVSFIIGSIMLLDADVPGFKIAWQLIGSVALVASALLLAMAMFFMRSRRRPVVTGAEQILSEPVYALEDFEHEGMVRLRGELWRAESSTPIHAGQPLRVVKMTGLTLEVVPAESVPAHLQA
jgi:membrane-bound serine protease (ClpP class)